MKKHQLVEMEWPQFGVCTPPPAPSLAEYEARLGYTRARMADQGLSHLLVYADREHFANLY